MAYIKKINIGSTNYDIVDAKNVATLETSSTTTQSYEIGDYIVYNGILYKVTAAIAAGGTITVGTNVSPVTVSSELKSINSDIDDINSAISVLPSTLSDFVVADDEATPTTEVDFSSADTTLDPTSTESVALLTATDAWSARLHKISQMFKNIRYLLKMLGTSDFSNVASTVSGAIGNTALTTTATTLSGAVAEHENDISQINNNLSELSERYSIQTVSKTDINAISANAVGDVTIPCAKSGYTPIGILGWNIGAGGNFLGVVFVRIVPNTTNAVMRLINVGSSSKAPSDVSVSVLYRKD